MSYLRMSEFEDAHWDDFLCVDDFEVPCPAVTGLTDLGIEQDGYLSPSNYMNNLMEKNSPSYKQSDAFSLSEQEMADQPSCVSFDCSKMLDTDFSLNDNVPDSGIPCMIDDFDRPVSNISQTELFENTDSTEFCYNGLAAMGNFEEVDRMFRISDATFGIEIGREDKMESKVGNTEAKSAEKVSENGSSRSDLVDHAPMTSVPTGFESNICMPVKYEPDIFNGFHSVDSKEGLFPTDQGVGISDAVNPKISVKGHSKSKHRRIGVGLNEDTIQPRFSFNGNSIYNGRSMVNRRKNQFKQANQFDDIYLQKASNFHQLELVMEWLDLKTKLCIRDGLYRLAQGAEHRHRRKRANLSDIWGDEGINMRSALVDMEIFTNPIDRSIAQLLFHTPSAASTISNHD